MDDFFDGGFWDGGSHHHHWPDAFLDATDGYTYGDSTPLLLMSPLKAWQEAGNQEHGNLKRTLAATTFLSGLGGTADGIRRMVNGGLEEKKIAAQKWPNHHMRPHDYETAMRKDPDFREKTKHARQQMGIGILETLTGVALSTASVIVFSNNVHRNMPISL